MTERRDFSEQHSNQGGYRRVTAAGPRNGYPTVLHRPYVWRGDTSQRDTEIAARLAAVRAQVGRRIAVLTDGPDPEWRSELAAEARDDTAAEPAPPPVPGGWCDACGYRIGSLGHQSECGPS